MTANPGWGRRGEGSGCEWWRSEVLIAARAWMDVRSRRVARVLLCTVAGRPSQPEPAGEVQHVHTSAAKGGAR